MTITGNYLERFTGEGGTWTVSAPTINAGWGVPTYYGSAWEYANCVGGQGSNINGNRGARVTYSATVDLSTHPFILFTETSEQYGWPYEVQPHASGALTISFWDNSGNSKSYACYANASEIPGFDAVTGNGYLHTSHYSGNEAGHVVDRTRTPIASVGTLNWAAVRGHEVHQRFVSPNDYNMGVGHVCTANLMVVTGTETVASVAEYYMSADRLYGYATMSFMGARAAQRWQMLAQLAYMFKLPFQIGNGSTATTFTLANAGVCLQSRFEDQAAGFLSLGPFVQTVTDRVFPIVQSATDNVQFTDSELSGASAWGFAVSGNAAGTFACTRVSWWRCSTATLGHGDYTDTTFEGFTGPLSYNSTSGTLVRCLLRNATAASSGLTISTAAGNYAALGVEFIGNAGQDITISPPGTGTWDLSGIKVASGYTLKIRNSHASTAITVKIPPGTTYSTSTAGGAITIDSAVTVTLRVTCLDEAGAPISGVAVRVEAGAGGPTSQGTVLISGTTNGSGVIENTSYTYTANQPLQEAWARKGSAAPRYKQASINGPITANGLTVVLTMVSDE